LIDYKLQQSKELIEFSDMTADMLANYCEKYEEMKSNWKKFNEVRDWWSKQNMNMNNNSKEFKEQQGGVNSEQNGNIDKNKD